MLDKRVKIVSGVGLHYIEEEINEFIKEVDYNDVLDIKLIESIHRKDYFIAMIVFKNIVV